MKPVPIKPIQTFLRMDPLPEKVTEGSTVMFVGRLAEAETEKPVSGKTIKILRSEVGRGGLLALGTTVADGSFSVKWLAKRTGHFDTARICAKFEGDDDYQQSTSKQYVIAIENGEKTKKH